MSTPHPHAAGSASAQAPKLESGILRRELQLGVVTQVTSSLVEANFVTASAPSAAYVEGRRHGRGEVGEFVLIEGQRCSVLARVTSLRVSERERSEVGRPGQRDVIGSLQLLGTVNVVTLQVDAGVETHPRIGDVVYAAPHTFIAGIPDRAQEDAKQNLMHLGWVHGSDVLLPASALVARHCAILGATGGGKSWTVARIVEELAAKTSAKIVLLDATGEYRALCGQGVSHCYFGAPPHGSTGGAQEIVFPPELFQENDFFALFQPSGKTQAPKLREAIRTLRIAKLAQAYAVEHKKENEFDKLYMRRDGRCYVKAGQSKGVYQSSAKEFSAKIEDASLPFDVQMLADQLLEECVWDAGRSGRTTDYTKWGDRQEQEYSWCFTLAMRVRGIVGSQALRPVFSPPGGPRKTFDDVLREHLVAAHSRVLRVDLSGLLYEHNARPLIVNALGRLLLDSARGLRMPDDKLISTERPLIAVIDEAHQFLGKTIGSEDAQYRLDAVELIAREGRKYGLCLCLATQRPRDVTESVLAQMGCFVVHRIVNDHDRFVIERASGEIDREAAAFLPSLRQGKAVIVGVDFPIPLTVQIARPRNPPKSDSARFTT